MSKEKFNKQRDTIESPEDINSYLRVTSPSMWFVLAAIIITFIGVILGSVLCKVSTIDYVTATVKNGVIHLAPSENVVYTLNMPVLITDVPDKKDSVKSIKAKIEMLVDDDEDENCAAEIYTVKDIPGGTYIVEVFEELTPVEFLFK